MAKIRSSIWNHHRTISSSNWDLFHYLGITSATGRPLPHPLSMIDSVSKGGVGTCVAACALLLAPAIQLSCSASPNISPDSGVSYDRSVSTDSPVVGTGNSGSCSDPSLPALALIESLPFDIKTTRRLSRYRSCLGHSMNDEHEPTPLSSLKHYVFGPAEHANCYRSTVYAPFDGRVVGLSRAADSSGNTDGREAGCDETSGGGFVAIVADVDPRFAVDLAHVMPLADVEVGDMVNAGDRVGYAILPTTENGSWDLHFGSVLTSYPLFLSDFGLSLNSYCSIAEFLTDELRSELAEHGVEAPKQLWFSKEEREMAPCAESAYGHDNLPDGQINFHGSYNDAPNMWVTFR